MSLASILGSRLSSSVAPLISWTAARSSSVCGIYCNTSLIPPLMIGSNNNIGSRSVWSEVIRQVPSDDPNKAGQLTFEDPDLADARMSRAIRAEAPLRRRPNFVRHEKKWMRRKRQKMERRYLRLQEGVYELKAYIKFKQDNKPMY